jgi:hypothetical protein
MTLDELIAEGERLSKPSLLLSPEPNARPVVARWGGQGRRGYSGRKDDRHKITFDCSWMNAVGIDVEGSIGVYDVDEHWGWAKPVYVDYQPGLRLADAGCSGGRPLYGHERRSLAPLQAICLYGGDRVTDWLAENEWRRTDYDIAESSELGQEYLSVWSKQSPLYSEEYAAVLHGWHQQWPEDDFYMPAEMTLLMWTFWDAEPWLELWRRRPNFRVELRIT